jgi:predicted dinucleotide-binding enzyme
MNYAIIGFGEIGQTLARHLPGSGIEVSVATTRDPESFASGRGRDRTRDHSQDARGSGQGGRHLPGCPVPAHADIAKALPNWQGKIIVDVTNAYGVPDEELGGQPSAKVVAQAFTGGKLVKGFNHLVAKVLDPGSGRPWRQGSCS